MERARSPSSAGYRPANLPLDSLVGSLAARPIASISTRKRSYCFETDFFGASITVPVPETGSLFSRRGPTGPRSGCGFGTGERRTEAAVGGRDARQHRVERRARKNGDARCLFPPAIAHPRSTSVPARRVSTLTRSLQTRL